jgi:hypothetical protein
VVGLPPDFFLLLFGSSWADISDHRGSVASLLGDMHALLAKAAGTLRLIDYFIASVG